MATQMEELARAGVSPHRAATLTPQARRLLEGPVLATLLRLAAPLEPALRLRRLRRGTPRRALQLTGKLSRSRTAHSIRGLVLPLAPPPAAALGLPHSVRNVLRSIWPHLGGRRRTLVHLHLRHVLL